MSSISIDLSQLKRRQEDGKIIFTYSAVQKFPEWPEGPLLEIIQGELFLTPSPSIEHQRISINLELSLIPFVRTKDLGEVLHAPIDVILSEEDVVIPDMIFISKDNSDVTIERKIFGVPDLIIEILSPANQKRDLQEKRILYEKYCVKEYWIVNPKEKMLEIFVFGQKSKKFDNIRKFKEGDMITSTIIKGFHIPVKTIFSV
ncbi:MAG: Uma2 family endonuclease [Candidatus Hodarchaeales archaeon]|jgi:Uma2 family endonuclease